MEIARAGERNELVAPAHFPVTPADWEATLRFALAFAAHLGIPTAAQVHFDNRAHGDASAVALRAVP